MNRRRKIFIGIIITMLMFIFYMSSQNGSVSHNNSYELVHKIKSIVGILSSVEDYKLDMIVRKCAHVLEYTVLSMFICMGVYYLYRKSLKSTFLLAIIFSFLYALTDELHQRFIAGREGCFTDVLIDTGGAVIGFILFTILYKIFLSNRKCQLYTKH